MSGRLKVIDRLAVLVLGLLLVAAGAAAVWWDTGDSPFPDRLDLGVVRSDVLDTSWWPWAATAAGVVLVLLGLRWLWAHLASLTGRRVGRVRLRGSDVTGLLTLDLNQAAKVTAQVLSGYAGVREAKGYATYERRRLLARLDVEVEPTADLGVVAARADEVAADLAHVVGRADLLCTVILTVAPREKADQRVE